MTRWLLIAAFALAGCETSKTDPIQWQGVTIVSDSLCQLSKRDWSIDDTPETIRKARAFNELWDARCVKKSAPKTS